MCALHTSWAFGEKRGRIWLVLQPLLASVTEMTIHERKSVSCRARRTILRFWQTSVARLPKTKLKAGKSIVTASSTTSNMEKQGINSARPTRTGSNSHQLKHDVVVPHKLPGFASIRSPRSVRSGSFFLQRSWLSPASPRLLLSARPHSDIMTPGASWRPGPQDAALRRRGSGRDRAEPSRLPGEREQADLRSDLFACTLCATASLLWHSWSWEQKRMKPRWDLQLSNSSVCVHMSSSSHRTSNGSREPRG